MRSRLRIISTDTMSGEDEWFDTPNEVEFSAEGVVKAIHDRWMGQTPDIDFTMSIASWVVSGFGGTACFILRWDSDLIHGVVYTKFNSRHKPR